MMSSMFVFQESRILMRSIALLCISFLLLLTPGCQQSLHPFLSMDDCIIDKNLVGTWLTNDSRWVFTQRKHDKQYELVVSEEGRKTSYLLVRLGKVGDELFLDFSYNKKKRTPMPDLEEATYLPVHLFAHVRQIRPVLQLAFPNPEWIENVLFSNPELLKHEVIEGPKMDRVMLTAGTEELQEFFSKQVQNEKLFGKYSQFQFMDPEPSVKEN